MDGEHRLRSIDAGDIRLGVGGDELDGQVDEGVGVGAGGGFRRIVKHPAGRVELDDAVHDLAVVIGGLGPAGRKGSASGVVGHSSVEPFVGTDVGARLHGGHRQRCQRSG